MSRITFYHTQTGLQHTFQIPGHGRLLLTFFLLMVDTLGSLTVPPRAAPLMFFVLLVGALKYLTSPPKGPVIDIFCVDGGRSRISNSASQGARRQCFLC
jgi:hypothetical protein